MARYIDGDALLIELQEELEFKTPMYTEEQNGCFNLGVKCAIRDVKRQPTADVAEVKHGEWVCVNEAENVWMCTGKDGCGGEVILDKGSPLDYEWYYCPNCGAKMDGGKE